MLSYSSSVGSTPTVITGSLNWNPNGTLQQLSISDGYNSANTQVCSYLYDDFIRVAGTTGSNPIPGVNCVNGSTKVWNQTFSYDPFGNITKTTTGPGLAFACAACYDEATNHYNSVLSGSISYDNNGNLLNDGYHTYTWLPDGHVATIDSNTITYDANGNKVEETVGGVNHQYVSAFGIDAQMQGTSEGALIVPLPGGVQALYGGGALQKFRFPDWQGSIRAESIAPNTNRNFSESVAFAPFGERYAQKGAPYNVDSFTGKPDQIVNDEYDFPAREEHNGQGRWISPDPMRGTGDKYVYASNNPLSNVDPYGLMAVAPAPDPLIVAFLGEEESRGDPLTWSESYASYAMHTAAIATSEDDYLRRVDLAFEVEDTGTVPYLQRHEARDAQRAGQPAQEAQNKQKAKGDEKATAPPNSRTDVVLYPAGNAKPKGNIEVGFWLMSWLVGKCSGTDCHHTNDVISGVENDPSKPGLRPIGDAEPGEVTDRYSREARTITQWWEAGGKRVQVLIPVGDDKYVLTWVVQVAVHGGFDNPPTFSPGPAGEPSK